MGSPEGQAVVKAFLGCTPFNQPRMWFSWFWGSWFGPKSCEDLMVAVVNISCV